ncbi:MAG: beta-lactamase family protein [Clostridia bacterium]|nr:beta-lactamase family protein [Clostridia bacterium]
MTSLMTRSNAAFDVVKRSIDEEKIPGAVLLTGDKSGICLCEAYGYAQLIPEKRPVHTGTLFDIASLSKLTGPWPGIIRLLSSGKISLESTLGELLPGRPIDEDTAKATVFHLLTHTAGLHPFMNTHGTTREERVDSLLRLPPVYPLGKQVVYSDLSFIFLGEILAAQMGKPLDECASAFWHEAGMTHTFYNPPQDLEFAATEIRPGKTLPVCGSVHDERSEQLGGVAGHAGVFSTAEDLGRFCRDIVIPDESTLLDHDWLKRSYSNQTSDLGEDRCLGWIAYREQEGGNVVGHTGFTGTSIRMDTRSGEYGILLTNRVHPTRANENLGPIRAEVYGILGL